MSITVRRTAVLPFLGIAVASGLAACAAPAASTSGAASVKPAETSAGDVGQENAGAAGAGPADGTYTADGQYVAPSGLESVTVRVTLADGIVAAVEVVGHASDPEAKRHQADFAGGIAAAVVGKPIEGLAVDRVAGSSLTGRGFNAALDAIRAEAG